MTRRKDLAPHLMVLAWSLGPVTCAHSSSGQTRANENQLEKAKAIARLVFEDKLTNGNWEVCDVYADDFVGHVGKRSFDAEENCGSSKGLRKAIPDLRVDVERIVAEGDLVALQWTARGTNTGTGWGLPATGKRAEITGMTFYRIVDDKIVEEWGVFDQLSALKQLGLLPDSAKEATKIQATTK